jgi:UDP-N-acetylmuramate--alanine ligase
VTPVSLTEPRTIHFVGAGGAGMSGLVRLALAAGHKVTGSDRADSATLADLRALGADVWAGHDASRLGTSAGGSPDLVVASTAIRADNPELAGARELGLPVLRRIELLAALMRGRTGIAVAGTHGKTTTTAMVTLMLRAAGLDPSYAIGGDVLGGVNAAAGTGPHFVAEADESDGSFLELDPAIAVVTNVEADHLDHWGDLPAVQAAFHAFAGRLPAGGTLVLCADDPGAAALAGAVRPGCLVRTYSTVEGVAADLVATGLVAGGAGSTFTVATRAGPLGTVELPQPGRHNVANALAATGAAMAAGAPFDAVQHALAGWTGVARRFQARGQAGGVTLVDDYAHHPTELAATLAAARLGAWGRVVAVFQPHLYSRTAAFADDFGRALALADVAVVTDVYAAREDPRPGVTGELVAAAARHRGSDQLEVVYQGDRAALAATVAGLARPGDLVLSLGAGDVTTLADELVPLLGAEGGPP